jgi:DNA-binding SARP family transcriptional activator
MEAAAMPTLNVQLFGKFSARRNGYELANLDSGRVKELFCYLLLHRNRAHSRRALAAQFWGDFAAAQAAKYLRQSLWQLQGALDANLQPVDSRVLLVTPDSIWVNPDADLWLDVAVFENACALVQGVPGRVLDVCSLETLERAVELYRGDLLEGWFDDHDWCLFERERLQSMYLALLDKLMGFCEVHRQFDRGIDYGTRILRLDRARERTHFRLMRLHYLDGDRTAALRQYERCVAALQEELGVSPARRTRVLCQQIKSDELGALTPIAGEPTPPDATPLPEVLARLSQLRALLADLQQEVQQDIEAVRKAIATNG